MQIIGRGKEILVCEGLWAGMWTGDCVTSCRPSQTCNLTEKIVLQGDMCWSFPLIFYPLLYTLLPNAYTHTHSQTHTLSTMCPAASIQRAGVAFTVKKKQSYTLDCSCKHISPCCSVVTKLFLLSRWDRRTLWAGFQWERCRQRLRAPSAENLVKGE